MEGRKLVRRGAVMRCGGVVRGSGPPAGDQPQASLCCHADTGEVTPAPSPAQLRCRQMVRCGLVATYLFRAERCVNIFADF